MSPEPAHFSRPSPGRPRLRLPPGACDAHAHVFGPRARFPLAKDRRFTPADAPKEALFALHARLGIERCVVVQSTCYGFDNWVTTDAIAARSGHYRGVALVPADVPRVELKRLDALGFCGVRFNYVKHRAPAPAIDKVAALGADLAALGWHLQLHIDGDLLHAIAPRLKRSPVPVVIDHMGRIDASLGLDQPAFRALLRLMSNERFWIKLSGAGRASQPWSRTMPFARVLIAEFGERVLWGTGWPHQNLAVAPDDGQLVDLLEDIAPSDAQRRALLVDNPQRLYRFADYRPRRVQSTNGEPHTSTRRTPGSGSSSR